MPCIANECRSGRIKPCPAPDVCYPDLHRVAYIEQRQEQAADMARQAGVHEPDDDVHAPSRGILNTLAIVAVCVLAALLLAHWGAR